MDKNIYKEDNTLVIEISGDLTVSELISAQCIAALQQGSDHLNRLWDMSKANFADFQVDDMKKFYSKVKELIGDMAIKGAVIVTGEKGTNILDEFKESHFKQNNIDLQIFSNREQAQEWLAL